MIINVTVINMTVNQIVNMIKLIKVIAIKVVGFNSEIYQNI